MTAWRQHFCEFVLAHPNLIVTFINDRDDKSTFYDKNANFFT
jgi:hypothetical protein